MKNQNDPVIDQKVIKEKKGLGWLWILLLILLALIAWWFFSHNKSDKEPAPAAETTTAAAPVAASEATATSEATASSADTTTSASQPISDNQASSNVIADLQAYYDNPAINSNNNFALDSIDFASESAKPIIKDKSQLDQVSQILNNHPKSQITIRGYADSTGTDNINDPLSAQRAKAVKALFVERKVAADRIHIDGEGDSHPIATNSTPAGRDMNRRVNLRVDSNS